MSWSYLINVRAVIAAIIVGAGLALLLQEVSSSDPPSAPAGDQHLQRIFNYVQDEMDGSSIPGVGLAIVNSDGTVDTQGFGKDGNGNAISAETPFWIGSNTKSFTALAVMQLVEAGRIDLDAPVHHYIPEFGLADEGAAAALTVRMLLNQTSGLSRADGIVPLVEERHQSLEDAVGDMRSVRPNRPVGESYEYSNLNFVIAGLLVERVSGESWTAYVQQHIFNPLEMTHSYTSVEEAREEGLSAVHRYWFGFAFETDATYLEGLAPTGYLYSSASDMSHYLSMYLNGGVYKGRRLLSEQGIDAMLTGQTNDTSRTLLSHDFEFQYGRGWFVGPFGAADDARWHLGNMYSFTAWMVLLPETNQAVVVLMNSGSQFELFGATSPFSRIPIGVVNVLRGESPSSGMGLNRFYVLFDAVALILLTVQAWSLGRMATGVSGRPASGLGWTAFVAPFAWEFGLAGFLLLRYPAMVGGSWSAAFMGLPDLSQFILAVSLLWVLTGVSRAVRLLQASVGSEHRNAAPRSATVPARNQ
jgi:CubicO group peptidase (beta-lactamase class C family)